MKRLALAGLVVVTLLLAAQVAWVQVWRGCEWGWAYDAMANGYVPACFSPPAESTASKPVGLAKPALYTAQPLDAWWFYRPGYAQDIDAS